MEFAIFGVGLLVSAMVALALVQIGRIESGLATHQPPAEKQEAALQGIADAAHERTPSLTR